MDHLDRVQPRRDARGIEAGEHRRNIDQRQRAEQHGNRPVELDGPAERLLVDDEDQQQRKHNAERQSGKIGQQARAAGFDQNQLAYLRTAAPRKRSSPSSRRRSMTSASSAPAIPMTATITATTSSA